MSLRELEDSCKVNIRFMYLMDNERPLKYKKAGDAVGNANTEYTLTHKLFSD